MALAQKLLIRQTQALVMTPQLMQAIKLLQLSHLDLAVYVDGELERNPLLERPADEDGGREEGETNADTSSTGDEEPAGSDWMDNRLESRQSMEARLDTELNNVFPDDSAPGPVRASESQAGAYPDWSAAGAGGRTDGEYNLETFATAETTLAGHLAEQVPLTFTDPIERMVAQYLIDLVDDAGYLPDDMGEAADRLGASPALIESVLTRLQTFDPPGV